MKSCKSLHVIALAAVLILAVTSAVGQQWKFGVMSDTQWIGNDDGRNPGTCSVDIVQTLNKQFIKNGVKFVVQVGDLVDSTGSTATSVKNTEDVRAAFAQELFNAVAAQGGIDLDHSAMLLALEKLANHEVKS